MKILFVYPEIRSDIPDFTGYYAEGPAVLSAVLRAAGHEAELLHVTRRLSRKHFAGALRQRAYDVLGFSSLSPVFHEVKRLAPVAKEVRDVPVLYGGVHPTLDPEGSLAVEGIDRVCVGEGEHALVEVLNRLEAGEPICDVPNIWAKKNGKVERTPIRGLIEDLDSLPIPDFSLFDVPNLFSAKEGVATMTASRGCPFRCSYCSNHKVKALYPNPGAYVRFKSVPRVIEEAKKELSLYPGFKFVDFSDDIFILDRNWLEAFAETFPRDVGVPFICNALVSLVDEERVALLRRAGCTMVTIGLESGSERLRKEVLHRPSMTNRMILDAARLLRRNGIKIATYNMIGLPTETSEEALETIRLNAKIRPAKINEFIFQPYPHTDIYNQCVELNLYDGRTFLPDNWRETTVLKQDQFPGDQVVFLNRYFKIIVKLLALAASYSPETEERVAGILRDRVLPRKRLTGLFNELHATGFTSLKYLYVKLFRGLINRRAKEFSRP